MRYLIVIAVTIKNASGAEFLHQDSAVIESGGGADSSILLADRLSELFKGLAMDGWTVVRSMVTFFSPADTVSGYHVILKRQDEGEGED